jgi:flagellar basal-body rod protein FlgB
MAMNLFSNAFGIHEKALQVRSQRMEVLARNIANADTPNFKAEDLDFKAMLKEAGKEYLNATHDKHYSALAEAPDNGMRFRVPFNSSFDGNTVEINVEQAQYGKAASDYQATLQFLENRIGSIRKALKGE